MRKLSVMWNAGNMVCELDFLWLGMRDSNPRIPDSESGALPLGESPVFVAVIIEKESQKSNFYFLWKCLSPYTILYRYSFSFGMDILIGILIFSLGIVTISYRYAIYRFTGDWEWAMRFLGTNGTILAIILIWALLMFLGIAYPFWIFDSLRPEVIPIGIR